MTLPDGKGSIQFDGWERWVKLQVGDTPGVTDLAGGAGLRGHRAVPVALRPAAPGLGPSAQPGMMDIVLVEVGGLDRADARVGLSEDVAELAGELSRPGGRREKVGVA